MLLFHVESDINKLCKEEVSKVYAFETSSFVLIPSIYCIFHAHKSAVLSFVGTGHLTPQNGTLTKEFFMAYIERLSDLNGKVNSSNFEASGLQSARNLYLKFRDLIFNRAQN
jgi:hypothetical protein